MPPKNKTGRNLKKTAREFHLKSKSDIGEDRYNNVLILSNYRNIFYNTLEIENLTVSELSLILWANAYHFFSREAVIKNLRIGINNVNKTVKSLMDMGYMEEYSPKQTIQVEVQKKSNLGDWTYTETVDKVMAPRYRLRMAGTRLANRVADAISEGVIHSFAYETREDVERMPFMKIWSPKN